MFYSRNQLPDNIKFETHERFSQVRSVWEGFVPGGHHLASRDIEAIEDSKPEDIEFRYVNILENNELIGIMYLQCLNFNGKHYDNKVLNRPLLRPVQNFILGKSARILVCGNLFRVNFQGFYFKEKARRELIFNCLLEYKKIINRGGNISGILVKDCSREFNEIQFGCHSFRSFRQDLTMELEIHPEWFSFGDYLKGLTRKYRQRASKIQSSIKDIQLNDLTLVDLLEQKQKIYELYLNCVQQQSLALGILSPDYFEKMKSGLGENFKVFTYTLNGEILAFSSHIYYPVKNYMEIHYIGMDYKANQKYQIYFNILFDGIRSAIEHKFRKIEMGRTAREAKASAGAKPVENHNYIWIRNSLVRFAVDFLGKRFENKVGDEWQKRHPFREVQSSEASQV